MQRLLRLLAFAGVGFCVLVSFVSAQPLRDPGLPVPESYFPGLKRLLETAVRQSPRMIARNTAEVVAEAERMAARSHLLPSAAANGSYYPWTQDQRGDQSEISNTEKTAYNVFVEQAVFHWGALKKTSRIGELNTKIAEGQTIEAYRALVGEIRTQYLQLIIKRLTLERARAGQRINEEGLAIAQERFDRKVISEADMFAPRMSLEQARLWTDRMQEDYDSSRASLGRLCGTPPVPDEEVPTGIPEIALALPELDSVVREFTAHDEPSTHGLNILRRQIEIERLNYDIANTRLRPKLDAVVGLTQDEQTYVYSANSAQNYKYEVQSLYTGVRVNWPIFDGFATRAAKTASLARRRQMERDYHEQVTNITTSVRARKRHLEFAARALAMSEQWLALARRNLRTKEDELARGLVSQADLNNVQLQFFDSQVNTFNARNEYLLRVGDLLSATMQDPALASLPISLK